MCWSFEVSVAFAVLEAAQIGLIWWRSRRHETSTCVHQQWRILPALVSTCAMELVEAALWSRPDQLVSVMESTSHACAARNQRLTVFLWLFVLPWQPFWVLYPCRRVGSPRNRDLLKVPEIMALVYAVSHCALYLYTWLVAEAPVLRSLEASHYQSNLHTETCTFVGTHGHLFWAFGTTDTMLTPNIFTYLLVWLTVVVARPLRFAAGPLFLGPFGFFSFLWLYGGSFEAGSVWCWSVSSFNTYVLLQPYIYPCTSTTVQGNNGDKTKIE